MSRQNYRIIVDAAEYAALKKAAAEKAAEPMEKEAEEAEALTPKVRKFERYKFTEVADRHLEKSDARAEAVKPTPLQDDDEDLETEEEDNDPARDPMLQFLPARRRARAAAWLMTTSSAPLNARIGQDGSMRKNFGKGAAMGHVVLLLHKKFGAGAPASNKGKPAPKIKSAAAPPPADRTTVKPFWWEEEEAKSAV